MLVRVLMTSEPLYKELFDKRAQDYKTKHEVAYNAYTIPSPTEDIQTLLNNKETLRSNIEVLKSMKPQSFTFDAAAAIKQYYTPLIEEYKRKHEEILEEQKKGMDDLEHEHLVQVALARKKAHQSVAPLEDKHSELLSYKNQLKEVLIKYNINPSDIKISDDITQEEFEALLDSSLDVCRKLSKERKNFSKIFYWPLEQNDAKFAVYYLAFMFLVFYFFAPFLSVFFIGYLFYSTSTIYKKVDKLRIAESMMYNLDFSKYMPKEIVDSVPPIDTSELESQIKEKMKALEEDNPSVKCEADVREAVTHITEIQQMSNSLFSRENDYYKQILSAHESAYDEVCKAIDAYLSNMKEFGTYISKSAVMSHKYVIGRIKETIDVIESHDLTNMVFSSKNRDVMIPKLKLYLANALLNVREKHLNVTIYDPDNLGAEFAEFYSKITQEYIKIVTTNFEPELNRLRQYAQENIKIIGEQSIDEYNEASEKVGKVTRDYELLIILSDTKRAKETQGFSKFMEYSARYGVMVWMYDEQSYPNTTFITPEYTASGTPIEFTSVLAAKVMKTYEYAIENSKMDGIDYFKAFAPKYMPRDKWWTGNTTKGIALRFGLADGDPSKGYPMYLDDKNVHCLMVGGTGSGKSVAINQMLMSLCCEYSPNELELVMVDFKNVEFSTFSRQSDTGILKGGKELPRIRAVPDRRSIIPHAKVLAGTKDGEYAISIFDYLCAEMDRRTEIFSKAGCKNIMEYREKYPNAVMPRIICLIDEFQVMFTEVEQKMVDIIKSRITSLSKLARFCGCHLWFTSQSMKGTLDKDILEQFTLRVALRCVSSVSTDTIGNPAASKIKSKVGYLYTNDSAGEDPSRNVLWRIPFAPTDGIMETLEDLLGMCEKHNIPMRETDFYDEKLMFGKEKLDEHYSKYAEQLSPPGLMVLGERTSYSLNKAPEHFKLTRDDGENIAAIAFERSDMLNLAMTFIDNIKHKGDEASIVIHSADRDAHTLLDVPNIVPEGLVSISDPNQDMEELVEALEEMVAHRQSLDPSEIKPLYFIAVQWEKAKKISREENMRLQDRFKTVLQDGPLVGVHFIFMSRELGSMPSFVYNACSHRIAGKCGEKESVKYIDSTRANRLPPSKDGVFAIYRYGSETTKFKVYQHKFTRELESRTVMIS